MRWHVIGALHSMTIPNQLLRNDPVERIFHVLRNVVIVVLVYAYGGTGVLQKEVRYAALKAFEIALNRRHHLIGDQMATS